MKTDMSICHIELVLITLQFKCSEQEFSDKIIKCKMLNVETLFQLWKLGGMEMREETNAS